jgi:hypothetical protein
MKALSLVARLMVCFSLTCLAACTVPRAIPPEKSPINPITSPTPYQPVTIDVELENHTPSASPPLHSPDQSTDHTTRYYLDVSLDYDGKKLSVDQTISYTNNTGDTIGLLPLQVPPAYQVGVFLLLGIQIDQIQPEMENELKGALIHLLFDPPLQPGQQIEINLKYQLYPTHGWNALGYTQRQMLLADWYPMIPPHREGVGWVISPPGQVGEHLAYPLSDFHLNLCLAPTRQTIVLAVSTPLTEQAGDCYRYQAQQVRNISLAISPEYHLATAESDQVTVIAYTFQEHADLGQRAADLALQSWGTFTDLFGDNQRNFLSIVEADIFDGLETDGLIYLSEWYYQTADPTPRNLFELLVVHETAHQWFYGYIHNDQAFEPWLDEALTTYSEVLFYEVHHPQLVDWWWDFRVAAYEPDGMVNASIYEFDHFRPYINAVYLRGALFLQALRDEIGDPAFFEALWQYAQPDTQSDQWRTADNFMDTFSQVPDADLTTIYSEFFH